MAGVFICGHSEHGVAQLMASAVTRPGPLETRAGAFRVQDRADLDRPQLTTPHERAYCAVEVENISATSSRVRNLRDKESFPLRSVPAPRGAEAVFTGLITLDRTFDCAA